MADDGGARIAGDRAASRSRTVVDRGALKRPRSALRREPAPAGRLVRRRLPTGFGDATVLQGKELWFTNLLDLDAAARIVLEFTEPAAGVIKHTNPCGVATGASTRQMPTSALARPIRCRPSAASSA